MDIQILIYFFAVLTGLLNLPLIDEKTLIKIETKIIIGYRKAFLYVPFLLLIIWLLFKNYFNGLSSESLMQTNNIIENKYFFQKCYFKLIICYFMLGWSYVSQISFTDKNYFDLYLDKDRKKPSITLQKFNRNLSITLSVFLVYELLKDLYKVQHFKFDILTIGTIMLIFFLVILIYCFNKVHSKLTDLFTGVISLTIQLTILIFIVTNNYYKFKEIIVLIPFMFYIVFETLSVVIFFTIQTIKDHKDFNNIEKRFLVFPRYLSLALTVLTLILKLMQK